jgi:hypothetical protein
MKNYHQNAQFYFNEWSIPLALEQLLKKTDFLIVARLWNTFSECSPRTVNALSHAKASYNFCIIILVCTHFKSGLKSELQISQSYDFNYLKEVQNIKKHKC